MRLLVTGGDGMVARHVAEAAARAGHLAWLADREWADPATPPACAAGILTFDVRDADAAHRAIADSAAAAVIHCAAVVGPALTLDVNVAGTAHMLHAAHAAGVRLVNLSTATLYGNRPDLAPLAEDDPVSPLTVYDGTKLMAETYCTVHRRTYGSDVASFRTGFVFGAGSRIGEYFLPRVLSGEAVADDGGDHPCDFTYALDLAEALVAAAAAPTLARVVYNVTGGVLRTRRDLARAVRALVPGAVIEQAPGIDPRRHLRGACRLDRARDDIGWVPRFTLEAGLADWRGRLP